MLTRRRLIALSAASTLAPNIVARAQSSAWPNRSVRLIVPLAAGGPTDTLARVLGDELSKLWGQQVVIENKPGGGTNIANEYVARSEPDGYTALFGTSSLATVASLYHSLGYDPEADLAPVSLVAKFPFFMFVPNSSPAKSVLEFIADAKAHPGKRIMGNPRHRQRAAPHRGTVLADGQDQNDARALSRRGAGLRRSHSRPHRLLFRQRRIADLFAIGPSACAGNDRRTAIRRRAGIADHRRGRRSRLRGRFLAGRFPARPRHRRTSSPESVRTSPRRLPCPRSKTSWHRPLMRHRAQARRRFVSGWRRTAQSGAR